VSLQSRDIQELLRKLSNFAKWRNFATRSPLAAAARNTFPRQLQTNFESFPNNCCISRDCGLTDYLIINMWKCYLLFELPCISINVWHLGKILRKKLNCVEQNFSWEGNSCLAGQKLLAFHWTRKFFIFFYSSRHCISVLSHLNPLHIITQYFLKIHFNITITSMPRSVKCFLNAFLISPVLATCSANLMFLIWSP
jgi:hypothetical protein